MRIEKEWEKTERVMKRNKDMGIKDEDNDDTNNNSYKDRGTFPFACFICKEPFMALFVTKCKYYFCEDCIFRLHGLAKRVFCSNTKS